MRNLKMKKARMRMRLKVGTTTRMSLSRDLREEARRFYLAKNNLRKITRHLNKMRRMTK